MTQEEMRNEFEKHALNRSLFITRRQDGDYDEGYTRIAWEYFKAGWELSRATLPPREVAAHKTLFDGAVMVGWVDGDVNTLVTAEMETEWNERGILFERAYK